MLTVKMLQRQRKHNCVCCRPDAVPVAQAYMKEELRAQCKSSKNPARPMGDIRQVRMHLTCHCTYGHEEMS
jgi:hypothetical protein